jgi:hypothetical protein
MAVTANYDTDVTAWYDTGGTASYDTDVTAWYDICVAANYDTHVTVAAAGMMLVVDSDPESSTTKQQHY